MKAIVIGAGELGYHLAKYLSEDEHEVTMIEQDDLVASHCVGHLDVITYIGNGASKEMLENAEIWSTDMLFAVTDSDEVNIVACLMARQYGGIKTVARIRNQDYLGGESIVKDSFLGINYAVNPDAAAAMEISRLIYTPGAIAVGSFAGNRVKMAEFVIEKELKKVLHIPLKNLHWREDICVLAAIERDGKFILPHGHDTLRLNDRVFVLTRPQWMSKVEKLFGADTHRIHKVAILGARRTSYFLAKILLKDGIDVTIIESDKEKCKEFSELLPKAVIINGDGTDIDLLKEEKIIESNIFAALTADDKLNILASVIVKHLGIERVITRISRVDYVPLLEHLELDVPVSPLAFTASAIYQLLQNKNIASSVMLEDGDVEIIEFLVKDNVDILNKQFKELAFPRQAIIGAVIRADKVFFPGGEDSLAAGDRIIVLTLPDAKDSILRLFELE